MITAIDNALVFPTSNGDKHIVIPLCPFCKEMLEITKKEYTQTHLYLTCKCNNEECVMLSINITALIIAKD